MMKMFLSDCLSTTTRILLMSYLLLPLLVVTICGAIRGDDDLMRAAYHSGDLPGAALFPPLVHEPTSEHSPPPGHLKPLGHQRKPEGPIREYSGMSDLNPEAGF